MLRHLSISNYALINSANIDFGEGFSVITGETGAGKSIMLGALSLILGQRNDASAILNKNQKCIVEAHFNIENYNLQAFFEEEDVDYDTDTVIRREILPSGKSRAFVNDTPVNLAFLKELTGQLIDIHSQHQNLLLGDGDFQLMIIDTVANNGSIKDEYRSQYQLLRRIEKERSALKDLNEKQLADLEYWEFQLKQLREINLQAGEQDSLEQELEQLNHVEEIKEALSVGNMLLSEHEFPIVDSLTTLVREIRKISSFLSDGENLADRIESVSIEINDIAREIEDKAQSIEYDPERLNILQQRIDAIYSLQQKHRVASVEELIELQNNLEEKIAAVNSFDDKLKAYNASIEKQYNIVKKLAEELTKSRIKVFQEIEKIIVKQLQELGMPYARFKVNHQVAEEFNSKGNDNIQFLFNANKSGEMADIPTVASGGELSRLMLCIKSLLSSSQGLPSLIFDEIDAGVSGEIADKMGQIMQKMGENIQVIGITHLPQIAGKGKQHFKVYKSETGKETVTEIKLLDKEERIKEIAAMLSGAKTSDTAIIHAKDLLDN